MLYVLCFLILLYLPAKLEGMQQISEVLDKDDNANESLEFLPEKQKARRLLEGAQNNDIKTVEFLCRKMQDINAQNNDDETALMVAADKGYQEIAKMLLAYGADVNAHNGLRQTALQNALRKGNKAIAKMLLDKDVDVNAQDYSGDTALKVAAWKGYKEIVEMLLVKGADVNLEDKQGITALIWATIFGHKDVVEILLAKGADVNLKDKQGITALICAAGKGYRDIVEMFLNAKADVNAQGNHSDTALILAVREGHKGIVELLLNASADVNLVYNEGITVLMAATNRSDKELVALLLAKGADINARDSSNRTSLTHVHFWNWDKEIVQLLELCSKPEVQAYIKDPKVYAQNKYYVYDKTTALMLACIFGHTEIISSYKDCSQEYLNAQDAYGHTALDYAYMFNKKSAVTLIYTFGNTIDKVTEDKQALLKKALESKELVMVEALLSVGAMPSVGLTQGTQEAGYLNALPRSLFAYLLLLNSFCSGD